MPQRCTLGAVFLLALFLSLGQPTQADDALKENDQVIVELYKTGKLFDKAQYKAVRTVFADRFAIQHAAAMQKALGDDHATLTAWWKERPEIQQDFYLAIHEKHDRLEAVLRLFRDLWKQSPEQCEKYASLAIATAVTWDDDRRAVYDYRQHQVRTKSTPPSESPGALENFNYIVDNEKVMQGRGQFLPWEFQVYLVDHRTPLVERKWAQANYLGRRPMIGTCYKEVPYDYDMLMGQSARLNGQPYTLENLRRLGGVCAMQADFAARVGKSIGVPAAYVTGQGNTLGLHAWVMWVELRQVTKTQIGFTLESHGRYFGDQYYTGQVVDPQTGQHILDRDMERRLGVVGLDRVGKRQAELVMRAYPLICAQEELDLKGKIGYLDRCLKVSPYNEEAWLELARMARDRELTPAHLPLVVTHLNNLIKTFNQYPDFVWQVFNDLLTVQPDIVDRTKRYEQFVGQLERAGRADLACEARLKLADLQGEQKKWKLAADGLAATIAKFPNEGRYVPRVMTKLQEVCRNYKEGTERLGQFYLQVLPAIPGKRGKEPSKHCIAMYEQAITFFKENPPKNKQIVPALEAELTLVRAGRKP
jgi:hypothetical protein